MGLKLIMLGDIVGIPGRRVVQQQLPTLRERYQPDLIIVNAENASGGSGLTPQMYHKLKSYGVDGFTLGDHVYRKREIIPELEQATDMIRPANLSASAPGKQFMKLSTPDGRSLYVITVLGRIYMNAPLADDPYAAVDRLLAQINDRHNPVLVEIHAEVTSEKLSLGYYLDGRVAAVVGTHTHIPTADAKILPRGTAYITDLGMTGPYDSVLGRDRHAVVKHMSTGLPVPFGVAEGDPRLCGVFIELNDSGLATQCERIELKANMGREPFA